jgi:hypothetical protein
MSRTSCRFGRYSGITSYFGFAMAGSFFQLKGRNRACAPRPVVQQRSAQTVDLVHNYAIQFARLDGTQHSGQSRPVHIGAGEAAVIIELRQYAPAFPPLT